VNFHCEDLQSAGLVLFPPLSPDYQPLLKDIQDRIDHPSPGGGDTGTDPQLHRRENLSRKTRHLGDPAQPEREIHRCPGAGMAIRRRRRAKLRASLDEHVRQSTAPAVEVWQRGAGSGGADRIPWTGVNSITLILDGVFFSDGEFVGPNQFGLWERITSEANARMDVAKSCVMARRTALPQATSSMTSAQ